MPRIQEIGPASTPSLYLENENQVALQRISQQYKSIQQQYQRQQIDYETAAKEIADMQAETDTLTETFQSNMRVMQQSQKFVDLGIISPEESQEAMWAQVLPKELHQKMYPKESADPQRAPFSPHKMEEYQDTIGDFASAAIQKKYGKFTGFDWTKKDTAPNQVALLIKYKKWREYIGYGAMTFDQQIQVDTEWDDWVKDSKRNWQWDPGSKSIKALRGKGPLTRGYGSPTYKTPLKPGEAGDPIQDSIAAILPKKKEPKKEPKPRIWARNPKTKKRVYSDDGGKTWQAE